jgi:hypothetical protein
MRMHSENNVYGKIIKTMLITSSGAEGINLRNTRYVHIVEPYWNIVRIEQVVGRARRICSHEDLPVEMRTVQIFMYVSAFTEEQIKSKDHIEMMIKDISRTNNTPITTDENLLEIARVKDTTNQQILKIMKETAIDCRLYNTNPDEPLVCYGVGDIKTNEFLSYPTLERDVAERMIANVKKVTWIAKEIFFKNVPHPYALNTKTGKIYTMANYKNAVQTGEQLVPVAKFDAKEKKVVPI